MAKGEIRFFSPINVHDLTDWPETFGTIKTNSIGVSGCKCVEWGTAFDESPMVAVGCIEDKKKAEQTPAQLSLIQLYKLKRIDKSQMFV
jgi:hypothetical protein